MHTGQLWKNLLLLILIASLGMVPLETMARAPDVGPEESAAALPFASPAAPVPRAGSGGLSGDQVASEPASVVWITETVDAPWNVGYYTSLELNAAGWPHISYQDISVGDLKYAYLDAYGWHIAVVDGPEDPDFVGQYSSLALDSFGRPRIAYWDETAHGLKYAYYVGVGGNCGPSGTDWRCLMVDSTGFVGTYCSLALDAVGRPHISYADSSSGRLKYASYVAAGGNCGPANDWQCDVVDYSTNVGQHTSLALDYSGYPHISYHDANYGDLKYAYFDGSTWQIKTVDTLRNTGLYTSLVLDSDGHAHISYFELTQGWLKYADYVETGGNCGPSGDWQCDLLLQIGAPGGATSLALDRMGWEHISYYTTDPDLGLGYAYYVGTAGGDCGPGNGWRCTVADSIGNVGQYASLAMDPDYRIHISYYDATNGDLKYAAGCMPPEEVLINGPDFLSAGEAATYTVTYNLPNATLPVTLTWDNGTVGSKAVYGWAEPGFYTITVTATTSCGPTLEITGTFVVTVCRPLESVAASGPTFLLTGDEGEYEATYLPPNATPPVTLTWDNGTVGPSAVYSWTEPAEYAITVTAANRCSQVAGSLAVTVCQPLTNVAVDGPDALLVDRTGTYTATYLPVDANKPVTLTWDNGTVGDTAVYSWTEPGLYTITVTATNPCKVVVTGTFTVSVLPCQPVMSVTVHGPDALLVDRAGTYTATYLPSDANKPVTLTWDNGTVGDTAVYSWAEPGLYTITVTATNVCGNVVSGTLAVSVTTCKPVSTVAVHGPDVLLVDETGTYTVTYLPLTATLPVTLTWDNGTVGDTAVYSWTEPGLYAITVTAANPCQGVVTETFAVSVTLCKPVSSVAVSGPDVLPVGETGAYTATYFPANATLPVTLTWDSGAVGPTAFYSWAETGLHTITVTATNRCGPEVSRAVAVDVCVPVSTVTVAGPFTLQSRQTGTYTATYLPSDATGPVALTWDNGTVGPSAVYSWTVAGTHALTVTASSICGDVRGSAWVTVFGKVYLPLVVNRWNRCFIHQIGFWEYEPNDTWTEANGPLCSGLEYYGHADDTYDLFSIVTRAGFVDVLVRHYTADGGQLVLYDENHDLVVRDPVADPDLHITATVPFGKYFIMLYGTGGYTTTQSYTLTAIFPQQ